jgi:hypothetical protein
LLVCHPYAGFSLAGGKVATPFCFMGQFPAPNPVEHPKEQSKIATLNANANFTLFFAMHKQTVKKLGTEAFFFQLKCLAEN